MSAHTDAEERIEGLTADLRCAVQVAWRRGAKDWARLNYPQWVEWLESCDAPVQQPADGEGVMSMDFTTPPESGFVPGETEAADCSRRPLFVVFDLDGTLALTDHRAHFLEREQKDWRGFYAACDKDEPCWPIIRTLRAFMVVGHRIEIWSGRSAEVRDKTRVWLCENGMAAVNIRMRQEGDHQPDTTLKAGWLAASDQRPDLVFEDRASMVAMWRSHGIVCAQVAPGEF